MKRNRYDCREQNKRLALYEKEPHDGFSLSCPWSPLNKTIGMLGEIIGPIIPPAAINAVDRFLL